jgi:Asp-tRNA(Asn)/Glu-tRNA(Gln) amidotransferase A subunit family amidase
MPKSTPPASRPIAPPADQEQQPTEGDQVGVRPGPYAGWLLGRCRGGRRCGDRPGGRRQRRGGSIRIPAACCGLFGLKPGRGLIPAGPLASEPLHGLAANGVISRSVRDTAAMLDVLAGAEAVSPYAPATLERPLREEVGRPGRLRIGFLYRSAINPHPHADAAAAVRDAASLLDTLGHHLEEVTAPHDDEALARDFLSVWFAHAAADVADVKRLTGSDDAGFEQDTLLMAALGRNASAVELTAVLERRHQHIAALARFHADYDLLLTPTLADLPRGSAPSIRRRCCDRSPRCCCAPGPPGCSRAPAWSTR